MSSNFWQRLRGLTRPAPRLLGTVIGVAAGTATVERADGAIARVRGEATVGQVVYYRDGVIEAIAPTLAIVEQEV